MKMTGRDLLELAALAVGITGEFKDNFYTDHPFLDQGIYIEETYTMWNPLLDDGDALRLAVECGLLAAPEHVINYIEALGSENPLAATRRAIVRAAAEIGRTMQEL